jgi:hypothetical protein
MLRKYHFSRIKDLHAVFIFLNWDPSWFCPEELVRRSCPMVVSNNDLKFGGAVALRRLSEEPLA